MNASFLEELMRRVSLPEVVRKHVTLEKSAHGWKGHCPFHDDVSPSFHVYRDHYHCFGCGIQGDAIAFVMQSDGWGIRETVEELARSVGMEMP
jgi:DNA primase